eukprot:364244-Chlamydomonas_euryale.AAC.2
MYSSAIEGCHEEGSGGGTTSQDLLKIPGHTKLIPWPEIRAAAAERALHRQAWWDNIKNLAPLEFKKHQQVGRMTRSCARRGGSRGLVNGALCNDCDLAEDMEVIASGKASVKSVCVCVCHIPKGVQVLQWREVLRGNTRAGTEQGECKEGPSFEKGAFGSTPGRKGFPFYLSTEHVQCPSPSFVAYLMMVSASTAASDAAGALATRACVVPEAQPCCGVCWRCVAAIVGWLSRLAGYLDDHSGACFKNRGAPRAAACFVVGREVGGCGRRWLAMEVAQIWLSY